MVAAGAKQAIGPDPRSQRGETRGSITHTSPEAICPYKEGEPLVKLGELYEAVGVKLSGITLRADTMEVALSAIFVIAKLRNRHGPNATVQDVFDTSRLPENMPTTPLVRYLLALPLQYAMGPGDVVAVSKLAVLVAEVQMVLDEFDLISTANGPVPRPRSI
jgi:hypothetical protein